VLAQEGQSEIESLQGVGEAEVDARLGPAWNQAMNLEAGKMQLGKLSEPDLAGQAELGLASPDPNRRFRFLPACQANFMRRTPTIRSNSAAITR